MGQVKTGIQALVPAQRRLRQPLDDPAAKPGIAAGKGSSQAVGGSGGTAGIASPLTERTASNGDPLRETSIRRIYDVTGSLYLDVRVIDRWLAADANGFPVELVFVNPGTPPSPAP